MPTNKRKQADMAKEREKMRKTNLSMASFVIQESVPVPDSTTDSEVSISEPSHVESIPDVSSPARKKLTAKHKVGFDSDWTENRPWLYVKNEENENGFYQVMFCKMCQKHKTKAQNGSVIWNEKGCSTVRLDKVTNHERSDMHRDAIRLETEVQLNISTAFGENRKMGEKELNAVACATKILNFLIQHNIPYSSVFTDLVNFARDELNCPELQYLEQGKNAKYNSNTTAQELMQAMSDDIEETVMERINNSSGYAIMNDETTDNSNQKNLAFCARYIDPSSGEMCVDYVKDVKIDDGKAETIFNETKSVIEKISVDKFVAFGSDGCNTMIGKKTGVATRLKEMKPEIVTIHCSNHKLALAGKDAFESIKLIRDTDDLLSHVFKYYNSSGNRTASLERIQKLMESSAIKKVKSVGHTRWLSHMDAVTTLRDIYPAVIVELENTVEAGNDRVRIGSGPSARGLAKKLNTYESIHIVHFLCDALKPVTNLALTFEKNDIDLSVVKPRKEAAITTLQKLKTTDGISIRRAQKLFQENNILPSDKQISAVQAAEHQFIDNLVEQIERRLESSDIIDNMGVFNIEDTSTFYGNDEVMCLAEHFGLDSDRALEEWDSLKNALSNIDISEINGPTKLLKVFPKLKDATGNCFDNVEKLVTAAAVLPVSTAEVERVFSEVNRTKTDLRNRMNVSTLHQLLMINRNQKYLDIGSVVKRWHGQKKRRI